MSESGVWWDKAMEGDALRELFQKPRPSVLYHYTNREALIAIFEDKSLHTTNIRHLTDAVEWDYAVQIALEVMKNRQTRIPKLFEFIERSLLGMESQTTVYVFSMSSQADDINQWRAYCRPADGYAIGFDAERLKDVVAPRYVMLQCEYDEDAQFAIVGDLLDATESQYDREPLKGMEDVPPEVGVGLGVEEAALQFTVTFHSIAPALKHKSFKAEAEWRLISGFVPNVYPGATKYRAGRSLLTPFHIVSIADERDRLPVVELWISPNPHQKLEDRTAGHFLRNNGAPDAEVCLSEIPYRVW